MPPLKKRKTPVDVIALLTLLVTIMMAYYVVIEHNDKKTEQAKKINKADTLEKSNIKGAEKMEDNRTIKPPVLIVPKPQIHINTRATHKANIVKRIVKTSDSILLKKKQMESFLLRISPNLRSNYHDVPIPFLAYDYNKYNRYYWRGYGGLVFWTDCYNCNWRISINGYPARILRASYDVMPGIIPKTLPFYQFKSGQLNNYHIINNRGKVYGPWVFKVRTGETIVCKIGKMSTKPPFSRHIYY